MSWMVILCGDTHTNISKLTTDYLGYFDDYASYLPRPEALFKVNGRTAMAL